MDGQVLAIIIMNCKVLDQLQAEDFMITCLTGWEIVSSIPKVDGPSQLIFYPLNCRTPNESESSKQDTEERPQFPPTRMLGTVV